MEAGGDRPRLGRVVFWVWVAVFCFVGGKALLTPTRKSCYPGYAASSREWITDGAFQEMISFQHLPYFGDLMAPFAACPDRVGAFAWAALSFGVYAAGLRAFLRRFPAGPGADPAFREVVLLVGLIVGSGSLANHQTNVLVVGCWLWAAVALQERRWWAAAVLFALPGFKVYTWAAGLTFAALYPRKLAGRFAVAALALFCLPFLFHPAEAVAHRLRAMTAYLTNGDHYRTFHFLTFYEAWRYHVGPASARSLLPVQALAGLAVPAVLWALRRRGVPEPVLIRHGLFLVSLWCVSFGPSIEPPTYLLAAPALGWEVARSLCGPGRAAWRAVLFVAVALLAGSPLYVLVGQPARQWLVSVQLSCLSLMVVYLVSLTAGSWALQRHRPPDRGDVALLTQPESRAA